MAKPFKYNGVNLFTLEISGNYVIVSPQCSSIAKKLIDSNPRSKYCKVYNAFVDKLYEELNALQKNKRLSKRTRNYIYDVIETALAVVLNGSFIILSVVENILALAELARYISKSRKSNKLITEFGRYLLGNKLTYVIENDNSMRTTIFDSKFDLDSDVVVINANEAKQNPFSYYEGKIVDFIYHPIYGMGQLAIINNKTNKTALVSNALSGFNIKCFLSRIGYTNYSYDFAFPMVVLKEEWEEFQKQLYAHLCKKGEEAYADIAKFDKLSQLIRDINTDNKFVKK